MKHTPLFYLYTIPPQQISMKVKLAFVSGLDLIYIHKPYPLSHTGLTLPTLSKKTSPTPQHMVKQVFSVKRQFLKETGVRFVFPPAHELFQNQTIMQRTWSKEWIQPPHDKTNKMACAPSKDRCPHKESLGPLANHWVHSGDSDQTERMPRLIVVFAGRTCHFVGFVMRRLNCLRNKAFPKKGLYNWATSWENLFCHMWTTKKQISLRIGTVWPAPLLFAALMV